MSNTFLFLGTGGSLGVPIVGCDCPICHSTSSYNNRLRSSALVKIDGKQLLIDAGPDFRQQALRYHIEMIDGLLLTHAHHDHIAGVDDLRPIYYRRKEPLPILLSEDTAQDIIRRYYYLMESEDPIKKIHFHLLPALEGEIVFEEIAIGYMSYHQGHTRVNGFRFGDLAYVSDIRSYPESIFEQLRGIKTLIISALRFTPSQLHLSVDEAVAFAERSGASQTWLTHISHELDHDKTNSYLPGHIKMAYDGLEINFK